MTVYEDQVTKEAHPNTTGTFNRIEVRDSVIVIPVFKDGSILMVETYRHGVGTKLLELPGGLMEEGETAIGSAKRELIEETGYSCDKVKMVNWFYTWPGRTGQRNFVLLATDLIADSNRKLDEREQITVLRLSQSELVEELKTGGRIKSCLTVAALLAYIDGLSFCHNCSNSNP
jgi:ADP-ribose pyrophosphatase